MMPGSLILSGVCHCLAMVALYLGLPHLWSNESVSEKVVIVDLVAVEEDRNLPEMVKKRTEEVEDDAKPVAEAAPPPPPPPPPTQFSDGIPAAEVSLPVPKPKEKSNVAKRPDVQTAAQLPKGIVPSFEKPAIPIKVKPSTKNNIPNKPDPFASVLKSVEELKEKSPRKENSEEFSSKPVPDPIENILAEANSEFVETAPLSMTELDSIRYQIQKHWNLPAGARGAHNMKVTLHILLGRDGTVIDVEVTDLVQTQTDPFFRAMAESAVRAVLKTGKILYLSPDKYHLWRDMKLNFDPSDMFG